LIISLGVLFVLAPATLMYAPFFVMYPGYAERMTPAKHEGPLELIDRIELDGIYRFGSEYAPKYVLIAKRPWFLVRGATLRPAYIYDEHGHLIDWTLDESGDLDFISNGWFGEGEQVSPEEFQRLFETP